MSTAEKRRYTAAEYLAFEQSSDVKHELYQGEIFTMGGASLPHNQIVSNLGRKLGNHLEDLDCQVLGSDQRVKVDATGLYTYPDLLVICGQPQLEDEVFDTLLNPKLIVEVLSESTEAYDRGQKFAHYRTIESFQEYVLVSQNEYRVEVFTRQHDGQWLLSEGVGLEANILFRTIDCRLSLEDIYRRVELSEPGQDQTNE